MYIKPNRRGGFKQFSLYLQGKAGNDLENESVQLISSSGTFNDINSFCIFANDIAEPKRGGKYPLKHPIEHISIRTRAGEILTPEMLQSKLPELLERLGYQNCPWILVQHMKVQANGAVEPHYHLGICRVDKNGKVPNPKSWEICEALANQFARDFGWEPAFAGASGNRFKQQKDYLARLWAYTEGFFPAQRLKRFEKAGFVAARHDKRNELVFVDRYGKPHSLHRIPALKKRGLKQADITAAFGFTDKSLAALPTVSKTIKSLRRIHNVRRTTKTLIRTYGKVGRIYKNALSPLRGGADLGGRGRTPDLALLAVLRGLSRRAERDQLRQVRGTGAGNIRPRTGFKPRPRRVYAAKGWWVDAQAAGTYAAMMAAGYTEEEAEAAVDRIYLEEEQRRASEQQYLDWLHGYDQDPTRGDLSADRPQPEPTR